jgi:hypothetical protein
MKINLIDTPIFERKDFGGRHYVSRNDDGNIVACAIGVTSWLALVVPPSRELKSFMMSFGSEQAYWHAMDTMAYYGTIMHIVAGQLAQDLPIILSDDYVQQMFRLNETPKADGGLKEDYQHVCLPATIGSKVYDAKRFRKDALAIKTFFNNIEEELFLVSDIIEEQSLTLIGIETTLADFEAGYAGTTDFIIKHEVKHKDDMTEEYLHIVDLKTGHSHYLGHALQLMAYRNLVAKYFENDKVYAHDLYMKDYREDTFAKFLNGKSKTKPYTLVSVEYDKDKFEHYYDTLKYSDYKKPDLTRKEINYNKPIEQIIEQIKGE